jgi:hypothetical protein
MKIRLGPITYQRRTISFSEMLPLFLLCSTFAVAKQVFTGDKFFDSILLENKLTVLIKTKCPDCKAVTDALDKAKLTYNVLQTITLVCAFFSFCRFFAHSSSGPFRRNRQEGPRQNATSKAHIASSTRCHLQQSLHWWSQWFYSLFSVLL